MLTHFINLPQPEPYSTLVLQYPRIFKCIDALKRFDQEMSLQVEYWQEIFTGPLFLDRFSIGIT
jgi:hypothetical protein